MLPYRNKKVIEFFLNYSWNELNKPIQKFVSVNAFKKYFESQKFYRESSSLPINSKINELLQTLITTKLNEHKREVLEEIFRDIYYDKITMVSGIKK